MNITRQHEGMNCLFVGFDNRTYQATIQHVNVRAGIARISYVHPRYPDERVIGYVDRKNHDRLITIKSC